MTSESEKLKACPFCGAPGNVEQYEEGWIVGCSRKAVGLTLACPLFPSFAWTNEKAEAIAAWNRRSPEGYDVAPLEWEDFIGRAFADSIVGRYQVWFDGRECRASLRPSLLPGHVDTWFGHSSSLDEAKAAAEADYRQRILSALRPRQGTAPAVGGEPFEWRCPACGSAETAARVKAEEQRDELELLARLLTKGLTGLTPNGSEYFTRVGENYYADTAKCVAFIRQRHTDMHDKLVEAVSDQKAANARAEKAEGERDEARGILQTALKNHKHAFAQDDDKIAKLEARVRELEEALSKIATLDPERDSREGFNEWGEASCFNQAQKTACDVINMPYGRDRFEEPQV